MNNECKRLFLFLFGCIPTRLFITYLAKTQLEFLKYMSIPAILIAAGFASIYIFKLRETGREVFGAKIWWNNLRPIHAFLWGAFAISAFKGFKDAWKILLVDTLFGLISFIIFHTHSGTFKRC